MATQDELLQTLTFIEKQSYNDIIDIALKEYNEKAVLFTLLDAFMTRSSLRTSAVSDAYATKYKSADVTNSYTVFKGITNNIGGQVPELDKTNGILNMFVYGDTKTQRELKRYVTELKMRGALLMSQILSDLDKAKVDLKALKEKIVV